MYSMFTTVIFSHQIYTSLHLLLYLKKVFYQIVQMCLRNTVFPLSQFQLLLFWFPKSGAHTLNFKKCVLIKRALCAKQKYLNVIDLIDPFEIQFLVFFFYIIHEVEIKFEFILNE